MGCTTCGSAWSLSRLENRIATACKRTDDPALYVAVTRRERGCSMFPPFLSRVYRTNAVSNERRLGESNIEMPTLSGSREAGARETQARQDCPVTLKGRGHVPDSSYVKRLLCSSSGSSDCSLFFSDGQVRYRRDATGQSRDRALITCRVGDKPGVNNGQYPACLLLPIVG